MELHRLKPMKEGYPEDLFNKLFQETKPLRRTLASQIDARRYGVTRDIIESWFEDKFIFVFNKHFDNKDPDVLKGFIINSLKMFKYRVLRKAYNREGEFYQSVVELEGDNELINVIPDNSIETTEEVFYNLVVEFMKEKLSDDAYLLFRLQIDPPPYIVHRIKSNTARIPNYLIAEFFNIPEDGTALDKRIKSMKREINKAIKSAKEYFKEKDIQLAL